MVDFKILREQDPEIYESLKKELKRQRQNLELIASENIASPAVLAACGTFPANKYAEGYPGKRYYGGCQYIDEIETLAIERAKKLFHAKEANVQPHSGASANFAVYVALLQPGDKVLAMDLSAGGHLSHISQISALSTYYTPCYYGVDKETGRINYDEVRRIALEEKPKMIVAGASAYSRIIDWAKFKAIADEVGAYLWVDMAHIAGLVCGGQHPSPLPYADVVTTTTHKTLRGIRGGLILVGSTDKHFDTEEEQAAYDERCAQLIKKLNSAVFPKLNGGPLEMCITAKAVTFKEALQPEFTEYAKQVVKNAKVLSETLLSRGVKLVSGGTDNHLMLVDLSGLDVTGKQLETWLDMAHITANKNTIPNETRSPFVTSGLRIGTPAVTTRGMKEEEMVIIGNCIADIIFKGEAAIPDVSEKVLALTTKFPIYEGDVLD